MKTLLVILFLVVCGSFAQAADDFDLSENRLFAQAESYLASHSNQFPNQNYIAVVDFSLPSRAARFFIKDLRSGSIESFYVAHGSGSDRDNNGMADTFSNSPGSNASSIGVFRTAEVYSGKHGESLKLDGLSSTNSNVRSRAVVIHGASYVSPGRAIQGRSWGCFAVPMNDRDHIVKMLKNGALLLAWN